MQAVFGDKDHMKPACIVTCDGGHQGRGASQAAKRQLQKTSQINPSFLFVA